MDWRHYFAKRWRNWRREESLISLDISSRVPWHKHIKINTSINKKRKTRIFKSKDKLDKLRWNFHYFKRDLFLPIGKKRVILKAQEHAIPAIQEKSFYGERYYVS